MSVCVSCIHKNNPIGTCCDVFKIGGYRRFDGRCIVKTAYRAYVAINKKHFDSKYRCEKLEVEVEKLLIKDGLLPHKKYLHTEFLHKEIPKDPAIFQIISDPRIQDGQKTGGIKYSDNWTTTFQGKHSSSRKFHIGICHKKNPSIDEFLEIADRKYNKYLKYWGKFNEPHKEQTELQKEDTRVEKTLLKAKDDLTRKQFEAFKRTYDKDIKAVQLANEWGVSKAAVSKLIRKAKNRLESRMIGG